MHAGTPVLGEWLETDGLGGYAMGTADGVRRRRYHGLLTTALAPPVRRVMLVAGVDAWVTGPSGIMHLSSHHYLPDVIHPDGASRIANYSVDPWPRFTYKLPDGTRIVFEVLIAPGAARVVLAWRVLGAVRPVMLHVRPLLAYRAHHDLGRERPLVLHGSRDGARITFTPDSSLPALVALSNGEYEEDAFWYRDFLYKEEIARGFTGTEDLASPGVFRFDLLGREAALVLAADGAGIDEHDNAAGLATRLKLSEAKRRNRFSEPTLRAVDSYLVKRGDGLSIIAGYPWFSDWGRDTFISLRGLCLATARHHEALQVLMTFARALDRGMIPNLFTDLGDAAYNSVDASLWFVVTAGTLLERMRPEERDRRQLLSTIDAILSAYIEGTRYGIRRDERDGLVACGEPGVELTWMDAKYEDEIFTPRIGKPVEVQALWINALAMAARVLPKYQGDLARARAGFMRRFWNEEGGFLYDVVDARHEDGATDASFRANQLFAVGGLPLQILTGPRALRVVTVCEERLFAVAGLRSLAQSEPGYRGRYEGGAKERDAAYHQGTAWPYLIGAFIEGWVRVHGDTRAVRDEARARFFEPWLTHLDPAHSGHFPELADGDHPHAARGCPFQAWTLGEALRVDLEVLAPT